MTTFGWSISLYDLFVSRPFGISHDFSSDNALGLGNSFVTEKNKRKKNLKVNNLLMEKNKRVKIKLVKNRS